MIPGEPVRDAHVGRDPGCPCGVAEGTAQGHRLLEQFERPHVVALLPSDHAQHAQCGSYAVAIPALARDRQGLLTQFVRLMVGASVERDHRHRAQYFRLSYSITELPTSLQALSEVRLSGVVVGHVKRKVAQSELGRCAPGRVVLARQGERAFHPGSALARMTADPPELPQPTCEAERNGAVLPFERATERRTDVIVLRLEAV